MGFWLVPGVRVGFIFLLVLLMSPLPHIFAEESAPVPKAGEKTVVSLFWREDCGHCKREKEFLADLQREMPHLQVRDLNIDEADARQLFDTFTARFDLPKVTPITVIGKKFVIGFDGAATTGAEIRRLLQTEEAGTTLEELSDEPVAYGSGEVGVCPLSGPATPCEPVGRGLQSIALPFIGSVDPLQFTLPMLSVVLGLVDGFNPCAMWVLVAFLTALSQVGSVKKMIQYSGLFILAQGIMYFFILNSWYIAFDFIKADRVVTPIIGLVALGGGIFFLWEFARSRGECKVTDWEKRARTVSRLNAIAGRSLTPMAVLGILGIAFSVNVVEFACSIGIPQAYTKILDLNQVGFLKRETLMGIYILFYMLDDLVVFGVAIWSFEKIGLTTRYSRLSNLLGGIIMIILGLLLLLAPEKLRF